MIVEAVPYRREFRRACIDLVGTTWNFNHMLPDRRLPNLVNEFFFDEALAASDYTDVLVDGDGGVHGYLFGYLGATVAQRLSVASRVALVWLRVAWQIAVGAAGSRRDVFRRLRELTELTQALEAARRENDAFVSLFLVSPTLRGQGWGKRLMQRFEAAGIAARRDRMYLWTDAGCNYGFYDHEGFERVVTLCSRWLADNGEQPNGFAYVRRVPREVKRSA